MPVTEVPAKIKDRAGFCSSPTGAKSALTNIPAHVKLSQIAENKLKLCEAARFQSQV